MPMRVELPWPPKGLSPNDRPHWAEKARVVKAYRGAGFALTREAMGRAPVTISRSPVAVRITFCPPSNRARDMDNLIASFKSAQDGIAQALRIDDSSFAPTYHIGPVEKGGKVAFEVVK